MPRPTCRADAVGVADFDDLQQMFAQGGDRGAQRMFAILGDPEVQDIQCNRFDRIFYTGPNGRNAVERVFAGPEQYVSWINQLLLITDVGYTDIRHARTSVVEGSFRADRTDLHGSVIILTSEITRGDPAVTIRLQPITIVTLDQMHEQRMMSADMRYFLELAVRGRLNILISGGSGVGKTTVARALSWFIDPAQRVCTCEEIDELHLDDRLPNVVAMTTFRDIDERGQVIREERLEDLVRYSLRLRPDRIWVGETRGREAYALVKAALSGHDGSVTTIHANHGQQAVKQLISYMQEGDVTEEVARDQVSQAFHIVVQIAKVRMGRRVITEITELEPVREGTEQRRNPLWRYNPQTDHFERVGNPTPRLQECFERYGVNWDIDGPRAF